jgi:hydrogenase maturation protein HypF
VKCRLYITVRGAVQGVGFRPFIYRLATEMDLKGYVLNSPSGVTIELEGEKILLDNFLLRLEKEKPSRAIITSLEFSFLDSVGFDKFEIKESKRDGEIYTLILPDIAVCSDCLEEMFDPKDRRYLYPFINCTNCGPRFSIIESLPYDRPNTSMKIFQMCEDCQREYENPLDRRFHAQPIACPVCGPHIELQNVDGKTISSANIALKEVVDLISKGKIIALKGLGGFQLLCDARSNIAVEQLRFRKQREEKPFALMFPTIDAVKELCLVNQFEERLLLSPESPIVLLKIQNQIEHPGLLISSLVAPNNPYLGVMMPYTPLHHLLMRELKFPIIATSGNLSDEPMCIDEKEALNRLSGIADYFLVHNRPIVRQVDDSIVRVLFGRESVLRRARGYAPLPISLNGESSGGNSIIAVGGHLKNTVALKKGNDVFISQHIGDLETEESYSAFIKVIDDFKQLYQIQNPDVVCDMHPEYLSSKYARKVSNNVIVVQHHEAHIAACRAENQVSGAALGVAWDGTGLGLDGTIWGGEFFSSRDDGFKHFAQFRKFPLPGGEAAIKEPRRSALGLLYAAFGESIFEENKYLDIFSVKFSKTELQSLRRMLDRKINCPFTSSVGRLFDAVSSLVGISDITKFEGQSAMKLEFTVNPKIDDSYSFDIIDGELLIIDWKIMIDCILSEISNKTGPSVISSKFHNTLAHIILKIAQLLGENKIVLSGGCFQNVCLLQKSVELLEQEGYKVYWHQRVPPNDGGISLGQIAIAINGKM